MSSYTDIQLINCNRSASVEALGDNDTNPAIFTNTLQQTLKLNVGDQVSLERAFVNEVGAGNPSTIEYKGDTRRVRENGVEKSTHQTALYTRIVFGDYNYDRPTTGYDAKYRLGNYLSIRTDLVWDDVDLKDNHVAPIIGYYITANEYPNYVQQPRRWLQAFDTGNPVPPNPSAIYTEADTTAAGECRYTINPYCYAREDWIRRNNPLVGGHFRQRVDNTRYTLFVKESVSYEVNVAGHTDQYPPVRTDGVFSECEYYRVRERIDLNVKKGFNTPTAVAEQITNQLVKPTKEEIFEIYDGGATPYLRPLTQVVETQTHKSFNAQNFFYCKQANYTAYIGGGQTQAACNWIASLAYIAVKRPEIYEQGRNMAYLIQLNTTTVYNRITGLVETTSLPHKWDGMQVLLDLDNSATPAVNFFTSLNHPLVLNVEYNEHNLRLIRTFLDTQKLYPELWNDLENMPAYSSANDNVPKSDSSRFIHFNPFNSDGAAVPNNAAFGSDGFHIEAGAQDVPKSSIPVFFNWDETQRDVYVRPEDWNEATDYDNTFSYGFAQPFKWESVFGGVATRYFIRLRPDLAAGIPHQLFTDLGTKIDHRRRCGYDFHATAFSTTIITPHSGYSYADIGTKVRVVDGGVESFHSFSDTSTQIKNVDDVNTTDISPYMTQTYIGANSPALVFDGETNRFKMTRLHTANNVGNTLMAGCTMSSMNNNSMYPPANNRELDLAPPPINSDQGDTVYKINPRPSQFGYSPTFKPYNNKNQSYRVGAYPNSPEDVQAAAAGEALNQQFYSAANQNIEPYKIFDSHGGIYFEDWGANEAEWKGSLWDILGFEYEQLNTTASSLNVLSARVNNDNLNNLYRATTNAEIIGTDTKAMIVNNFGAAQYQTCLPYPRAILTYNTVALGTSFNFLLAANKGTPLTYYPEVVIKTQSISIEAKQLPKSVLKPYYTIRSSLISGTTAIGGNPTGANLPLMSIVDKYSAQNDYFLGNPSDVVYTITKPIAIADITTSIHDPDGTFANVDDTSAVVYKVMKNIQTPRDIVSQILEEEKEKDKKK